MADDAFTARLTGGELNAVQWIADGDDIILGTEGSIRVLGRNDEQSGFGPLNIRQKKATAVPTSYVPGFFIENVLIFLDVYRAKLYEAIYQNENQGYVAKELSAINEHLLGYGITSIAYQASPNKILWMTTDNGLLLAATYDRDQNVFGVSQCMLGGDGFAEWAMSLPGVDADGDQLWLTVKRTINGSVVRTVETLTAFYRDGYSVQPFPIYGYCSGFYDGAPTTTVTGLAYANGETYGVWADGVDLGNATVQGGSLVLPNNISASTIVYGLRQSSLARTLRLSDYGNGPQIGMPVAVAEAIVDLYQTGLLRVGAGALDVSDYDKGLDFVRPDDQSEQDPYAPAVLRTGTFPIKVDDSWANNGVCTIETNSMYPATVRAVLVDVEGAD